MRKSQIRTRAEKQKLILQNESKSNFGTNPSQIQKVTGTKKQEEKSKEQKEQRAKKAKNKKPPERAKLKNPYRKTHSLTPLIWWLGLSQPPPTNQFKQPHTKPSQSAERKSRPAEIYKHGMLPMKKEKKIILVLARQKENFFALLERAD